MFRLVCYVEDSNLPKVLHAVAGMVLNMEPPQPVANAIVKHGKVQEAPAGTKSISYKQDLVNAIRELDKETVTIKKMAEIWTGFGGEKKSVNFALMKSLIDKRVLEKTPHRGVYKIVKHTSDQ